LGRGGDAWGDAGGAIHKNSAVGTVRFSRLARKNACTWPGGMRPHPQAACREAKHASQWWPPAPHRVFEGLGVLDDSGQLPDILDDLGGAGSRRSGAGARHFCSSSARLRSLWCAQRCAVMCETKQQSSPCTGGRPLPAQAGGTPRARATACSRTHTRSRRAAACVLEPRCCRTSDCRPDSLSFRDWRAGSVGGVHAHQWGG
jgi:hypothetical protein